MLWLVWWTYFKILIGLFLISKAFSSGIDLITGGNHSFDKKKDVQFLHESGNVLRPDNYPEGVVGSGFKICDIKIEERVEKLAVINLMGQFAMPLVENPFNWATKSRWNGNRIIYCQKNSRRA